MKRIVFSLAMLLLFMIPRLTASEVDLQSVFKGITLGIVAASLVATLYSLGPTRSFVLNTIFSIEAINPGWKDLFDLLKGYQGEELIRIKKFLR